MEEPAPIAIVGLAFRLPGKANNLDSLDKLLKRGRSGYIPVPRDRWNRDAFYSPQQNQKGSMSSRHGYYLQEDISKFDARFFQVSRHEACNMDPKQRLLLKTTYEALENAGMPMEDVRGTNTSVFVSTFTYDFERIGYREPQVLSGSHVAGAGPAIIANRISYFFDLKGPSVTLDTGCSGGLVALHQACQSLRLRESTMAIASGVQLLLDPDQSVNMSTVGILNPDGHCYAFDSRGNGYGRGEGVATLILKPLTRAIADDDHIHSVILNSGINQDGRSAGSLLSPNGEAQKILMQSVYAGCGLDPADTPYVEAHGTGTKAGDEQEISSIHQVFSQDKERTSDIIVGSVKANLGHLEATAGLAGLLKAIAVLNTGSVPPQINFNEAKLALELEKRHIHVPKESVDLPPGHRRASINSFGYGGTNSHVIIESFDSLTRRNAIGNHRTSPRNTVSPECATGLLTNGFAFENPQDPSAKESDQIPNGPTNGSIKVLTGGRSYEMNKGDIDDATSAMTNGVGHSNPDKLIEATVDGQKAASVPIKLDNANKNAPTLFLITAISECSLNSHARGLQDWISRHKETQAKPLDLAHTLLTRRSLFPWRQSIVASSFKILFEALSHIRPVKAATETHLAFVFTGQGAQWAGMGRALMVFHAFKKSLLQSDNILHRIGCSWSLVQEMFADEQLSKIGEARIAQPATTALQIALVDLLSSLKVKPKRVIGHSSGEIGAAYAAGALNQEAAMEVAYWRGMYSGQVVREKNDGLRGAMLATGLGERDVANHISSTHGAQLCIACINSPQSTTISGDESAIDDLKESLDSKSIFARKLKVDTAYHSPHMRAISGDYRDSIQHIVGSCSQPTTSFFSSVTPSRKMKGFDADYWAQNLISPVKFADALELLARDHSNTLPDTAMTVVEIGPSGALAGPVKQTLSAAGLNSFSYLSVLDRKLDSAYSTRTMLGRLLEQGYPVDGKAIMSSDGATIGHQPRLIHNLPSYSFDESPYWAESRISAAHRFRQFPRHDLCGLLDPACSIHEPRWRHFLSLESLPWLKDHVLNHEAIFPASGYVAMAIEALRQLRKIQKIPDSPRNFLIDEVIFSEAIAFSLDHADATTEVQLTLTPSAAGPRWLKFRVFSYSEGSESWGENCTGVIGVDSSNGQDEVRNMDEDVLDIERQRQWYSAIRTNANQAIEGQEFYGQLKTSGNAYGPTFTMLADVLLGRNEASATMALPDLATLMTHHHMQPSLIHPAPLDAMSHLTVLLSKESCLQAAVAIGKINDMVISADFPNATGTELRLATSVDPVDTRTTICRTTGFHANTTDQLVPVLKATYTVKAFGPGAISNAKNSLAKKESCRIVHQPDADLLDDWEDMVTSTLSNEAFQEDQDCGQEIDADLTTIEKAAAIFIRRAIRSFTTSGQPAVTPYMQDVLDSMTRLDAFNDTLTDDEESRVIGLAGAAADVFNGQAIVDLGRTLLDLLVGKVELQDSISQGGFRSALHDDGSYQFNHPQLARYLEAFAFKKPNMKILEIYSHVCAAETEPVRTKLMMEHDGRWLDKYDLAKLNGTALYRSIKGRSTEWPEHVRYRTLNLLQSPQHQEFDTEYDIVIITDPELEDTPLAEVLAYVHQLLRPGGKMILVNILKATLSGVLTYYTVSGLYRLRALGKKSGDTFLTESQWDRLLRCHDFSGVDSSAHGSRDKQFVKPMMITTALSPRAASSTSPPNCQLIQGFDSAIARDIVAGLKGISTTLNDSVVFSSTQLADVGTTPMLNCLILDIAEHALLLREDADTFGKLQQLLTSERKILWVALHETSTSYTASIKSMIQGTSRVLRRENGASASFTVLDVDCEVATIDIKHLCHRLLDVANKVFHEHGHLAPAPEPEYVYRDGRILIPRLQLDRKYTNWIENHNPSQERVVMTPYDQNERPLQLELGVPGLLSSLRFQDDFTALEDLEPWEIGLSSKAHGINFKDVFISLGQMSASVQMVGEVAGVITAVGKAMGEKYHVGDRVMGFMAKPYASMPRLDGRLAQHIPQGMEFTVAASIPCAYATAYHCLFTVANFKKGQSILVTAASGGVGQATVQLAQHAGAGEIFVTLGSSSKKQLIMDTYGVPETHIFSSRTRDFKRGIRRLTSGRGVDVVLNSLAGEMLTDAFDCVAKLGTFCEIGKGDIYKGGYLSLKPFDSSVTFAAVDLVVVAEQRPESVHEYLGRIAGLFEEGALRPMMPINVFGIGQIEEAFRLIAGRKHTGKVVLESSQSATVQATVPKPLPLTLSSDGTYVIVGGLGNLGKELTAFLSSRGAGQILLLSRRAVDDGFAKTLSEDLGLGAGTNLQILQCDITQAQQVADCAEFCRRNLSPVRGVIHSGMLLKDRPFSIMSEDDFRAPLGPKVAGTTNLSESFESPSLEFFIMLTSTATILGNGSQANYTTANAFQDAFAQANAAHPSTHYVALSLGAVEGTDAVANTSLAQNRFLKSISISKTELLRGVEYAMSPQSREDGCHHLVMGISRQGMMDADDILCLSSPFFSHLFRGTGYSQDSTQITQVNIKDRIRAAQSVNAVQELIQESLTAKCASFINRDVTDFPLDQPLSSVGFDSLVSIELKNWILSTFDAMVQTAQISGARNLPTLVAAVTAQSKLVSKIPDTAKKVRQIIDDDAEGGKQCGIPCCVEQPPPKMPLLTLDQFLISYSRLFSLFAKDPAEVKAVRDAVADFGLQGGVGESLFKILKARVDNSETDLSFTNTFLTRLMPYERHAITPWNVFAHTYHDGERAHGQAERAALMATVAFQFSKGVRERSIKHDWLGSRPLCSYYWSWMFSSVREPRVWCDKMQMYPDSCYVAVLRKGHLFRVPLQVKGADASFISLQRTFQQIIDLELDKNWLSILTTDTRDSWALNRERLKSISKSNRAYFEIIEEATFVLCLDDEKPSSNEERLCRTFLHDGSNRWFDKTTQFVVFANGRSSQISEHTMLDGTTPLRLTELIHQAIKSHVPCPLPDEVDKTASVEYGELKLQTTPEINTRIETLRQRYERVTSKKGYRHVQTTALSYSVAAGTGLTSKACLDLAIQVAARMHFGRSGPSWDVISMQHFHKSCPQLVQTVDQTMIDFCEAALDPSLPATRKKHLMLLASGARERCTQVSANGGQGCFVFRQSHWLLAQLPHLLERKLEFERPEDDEDDGKKPLSSSFVSMRTKTEEFSETQIDSWSKDDSYRALVPDTSRIPALFTNPAYKRAHPGDMVSAWNEGDFVDAATCYMGDNISVSKRIGERCAEICITANADQIDGFRDCFDRAAKVVRDIVTVDSSSSPSSSK